jgi:sortase A
VRIGLSFFVLGVLLVAFVAYQLWGTALYEEHAQSHLKSELAQQLHTTIPAAAPKPVPASVTTSTSTSTPTSSKDRNAGSDTDTDTIGSGREVLASQTASSISQPLVGGAVGQLWIPRIGISDTIVQGVGDAQLEQGPGHYPGTALPGEVGNVAIAGHRTTYAHPFYNLDALAAGDDIYVLTTQGYFRYTVTGSQIVSPDDTAVLDPTPGKATLTLTTCNPRYSAAQRLVVTASFDGKPAQPLTTTTTTPKAITELAGETTSSSLGGDSAPWLPPVLWGLLTLAIAVGAYVLWRLSRVRALRIVIVLAAVPLFLLALLVCFEHVSLALPGSF